jgi:peptide/nickel transport system permease protein
MTVPPTPAPVGAALEPAGPPPPGRRGVARRLWADRNGRIGVVVTGVIVLGGLAGLFGFLPYDTVAQDVAVRLKPPSVSHPFGTDQFGRDVFSRALSGIFASLRVAVVSVAAAAAAGALVGVVSGYAGGWADAVVGRLTDVLFAFPAILLALTVISALGRGWPETTLAIAIVYLPIFIRTARGPTLTVRNAEYVKAGRVLGFGPLRLVGRHVLPNVAAPILVQTTLAMSWAVLTESTLSFLGLGTQPPQSSLGLMVADGRTYLTTEPWMLVAPAAVIVVLVVGLNLLGDGLRAALDPAEAGHG